jgi:hypothetical protein
MKILKLWFDIFKKDHFFSVNYRVLDFFSALSNVEFEESDMVGADLSTPWGANLYKLYNTNAREGKIDYQTEPVDYFCLVRTSPRSTWTATREADAKHKQMVKIKEVGSKIALKNPEMPLEELENLLLGIGDVL